MKYSYAVVNEVGKCYEVQKSTNYVCDRNYVPLNEFSISYLSKYYYPMAGIIDRPSDFQGSSGMRMPHTL